MIINSVLILKKCQSNKNFFQNTDKWKAINKQENMKVIKQIKKLCNSQS